MFIEIKNRRKKLLGSLLVVAIVAVAAFNVNMNSNESEMSVLALANVEALATTEKDNDGNSVKKPQGSAGFELQVEYKAITIGGRLEYKKEKSCVRVSISISCTIKF